MSTNNSNDLDKNQKKSSAKNLAEEHGRAYERENYEPEELENPLPKWFSIMAAALVFWGFGYFYFQGIVPLDAGDHRTAIAPPGSGPVDGKIVYAANCVGCHQATGLGISGAFPPLAGSEWVLTDPQIPAQILLHGLQGPIDVMGVTYAGVMPTMTHLSDSELTAVLNYIRTDWGNSAPEVSNEWMAEQRALFPEREPWAGGEELIGAFGEPSIP